MIAQRKPHAGKVDRVNAKLVQQTLAEISEKFVLRIDASVLGDCVRDGNFRDSDWKSNRHLAAMSVRETQQCLPRSQRVRDHKLVPGEQS